MFCHSCNYGYRWYSWLGLVPVCFIIFGYSIMDKFRQIYLLSPIVLLVIAVFAIYVAYQCSQDEQVAKTQLTELTSQLEQLQQTIARNNQIIADNEQSKRKLENQSIEWQEQINEQLKDIDCANQFVPIPVSNSLYNRAKNLRQPTDTSKSIK